jgi:ParB family chromosome partitioning protein
MSRQSNKAKLAELDDALADLQVIPGEKAMQRVVPAAISSQIRVAAEAIPRQELEEAITEGRAILEVDPECIDDTRWRDRGGLTADDEDFRLLVDSIRAHGQISPVALRRRDNRFEIAFGHRRVEACRVLGRKVKAVIVERGDRELVVAMLIENQARKDLSAIEKARSYQRILNEGLFDRATLAAILGVSENQVHNITALNRMPSAVLTALGGGQDLALNVAYRLVLALDKAPAPPEELLERVAKRSGDGNAKARYLMGEVDRAAREAQLESSLIISDERGRRYARLTRSGSQLVLRFQPGLNAEAVKAIAQRFPVLYEEIVRNGTS